MRLYIMVKKQSRRRCKLVNLADPFNHVVVLFVQNGVGLLFVLQRKSFQLRLNES